MAEDKFREKIIRLMNNQCYIQCKVEWSAEFESPRNIIGGLLSGVIDNVLLVSLESKTIEIPIDQILDWKMLGPDWRWHDDLMLDEASFSGRVALERRKKDAERT